MLKIPCTHARNTELKMKIANSITIQVTTKFKNLFFFIISVFISPYKYNYSEQNINNL